METAEAAYRDSKFSEALSLYEKEFAHAANDTVRAALYFNAGNAAFRSGKPGLALAYYYRAADLSPGDSDIAYNLALVDKSLANNPQRGRPFARLPATLDLFTNTAADTLLLLALLGLTLFLSNRAFPKLPSFLAPLGLSLAVLGGSAFGVAIHFHSVKDAVVIADKSIVRSGPAETFPEISTLAQGSVVGIEAEQSGWLKIYFQFAQAEGKRVVGWADPSTVLKLDP